MSDTIRKAKPGRKANHDTRRCDVCRRDRTKGAKVIRQRIADEMAFIAEEGFLAEDALRLAVEIDAAQDEAIFENLAIDEAREADAWIARYDHESEKLAGEDIIDYCTDPNCSVCEIPFEERWNRMEQDAIDSALDRLARGNSRVREFYA